MRVKLKSASSESASKQIAGFIAKFDPKMAKLITSLRTAARKRFPTSIELVYDNYNFLVFGFCTTERASDCLVSLAANAHGVTLFFNWGASLADPHKILQGVGKQVRWIRLEGPATLARPEVEALLKAAVAQAKHPLSAEKGYTIVKSISGKQRPRRAPSQ
jgi:hypothetical protein